MTQLYKVICFLLMPLSAWSTYHMTEPEGFLWYKEALRKAPSKKGSGTPLSSKKTQTAQERNETLSKALDTAIHVALDQPNLENVQAAQRLQKLVIEKSEKFSKVWMIASLLDASHYDPESNHNTVHQQLLKFEKAKKIKQTFETLSKDYGLFYVWQDSCSYCERFLPIIKSFAQKYTFDVLAISRAGGLVEGIKSKKDNGFIDRYNTQGIYPALFLVHYKTKQVMPLAWGMTSLAELEENLLRLLQYLSKETLS